MTSEYYLVANDEKTGKPFIWGFHFPSVKKAKAALLPGTWAIDEEGNKVAERGA